MTSKVLQLVPRSVEVLLRPFLTSLLHLGLQGVTKFLVGVAAFRFPPVLLLWNHQLAALLVCTVRLRCLTPRLFVADFRYILFSTLPKQQAFEFSWSPDSLFQGLLVILAKKMRLSAMYWGGALRFGDVLVQGRTVGVHFSLFLWFWQKPVAILIYADDSGSMQGSSWDNDLIRAPDDDADRTYLSMGSRKKCLAETDAQFFELKLWEFKYMYNGKG